MSEMFDQMILEPVTTPPPPPIDGAEPSWVHEWLAGSADPFDVVHGLSSMSAPVREMYVRFPPGAVVRCACDGPDCGWHGIVVLAYDSPDEEAEVVFTFQNYPGGPPVEIAERFLEGVHLVGCRGGLTPGVMLGLLGPVGTA